MSLWKNRPKCCQTHYLNFYFYFFSSTHNDNAF
jgi:hypothetical protein